jgi:hypothetical protein
MNNEGAELLFFVNLKVFWNSRIGPNIELSPTEDQFLENFPGILDMNAS